MHFLFALLPLLALTTARTAHPRSHASRRGVSSSSEQLDARGLLDGLLGPPTPAASSSSAKVASATAASTTASTDLVGGLLGGVGGAVGGVVGDVGSVVGATVTTVGGVVEDVANLNLEAVVDTCVRLGTAVDLGTAAGINAAGVGAASNTNVVLAAGACVCVDALASVGLNSGVYAGVDVFASGGLYFNGSTADAIASSTQPGLLGLSAGVYNFDVVETCISAQVSLSNSHHDFSIPFGSCCARACDAGYKLDSTGRCVLTPTCSSTELLCNNACYPKSTYTCPSGLPIAIQQKRSAQFCPLGQSKCAVGHAGGEGQSWECVDTLSDLESCGGCMFPSSLTPSTPQGTDCTAIPNVDQVSCLSGSCSIQSCSKGFALSKNGTSCDVQKQFQRRHPISRTIRLKMESV